MAVSMILLIKDMVQKVFRTGNSLAVTIPSRFVMAVGIKSGDYVKLREEKEKGRLVYQFAESRQLALDEKFFKTRKRKQQ